MKRILIATAMTLSFTAAHTQAAPQLHPEVEGKLVSICKAIQSGSRYKVNKAIRASNLSYAKVSQDLRCNGMNVIEFAMHHEEHSTAQYLAAKYSIDSSDLVARNAEQP